MRTHKLKTWPGPFADARSCTKTFEFRRDDRAYEVGDHLVLAEWDPSPCSDLRSTEKGYTGDREAFEVTYILRGGRFGVPEGYCVMAIRPLGVAC
jgi:hypothetical protein